MIQGVCMKKKRTTAVQPKKHACSESTRLRLVVCFTVDARNDDTEGGDRVILTKIGGPGSAVTAGNKVASFSENTPSFIGEPFLSCFVHLSSFVQRKSFT